MTDDNGQLPDALLDAAPRLRQAPDPPAALESRVLKAARASGLIHPPVWGMWGMWRMWRMWRTRVIQCAAAVALLLAGATGGRLILPPASLPADLRQSARYLLLLAGDVEPAADGSTRAEEYGAWMGSVAARGVEVDGEELTGQFEVVSPKGTSFPEMTSMGGFFLIEAENDAAAAALARTCPHVKYGGSVIIRKVVQTREQ